MNSKTARFIWGLILLLVCGMALPIHLIVLLADAQYSIGNGFSFALCILGAIMGSSYIFSAINDNE